MRTYFNDRDVELAANDVIMAVDGQIRREDAKRIARGVLAGFGLPYRPCHGPKRGRIGLRWGVHDIPEARG